MASSMALPRVSVSGLINKLINPIRSVAAIPSVAGRYFNTNTYMPPFEDYEPSLDLESIPSFGVFFSPSRPLSQLLNFVDEMMDNPFQAGMSGMEVETRRKWEVRLDEDVLFVRIDMPGLGEKHVKVLAEENAMIIIGEGPKFGMTYCIPIDLPEKVFKLNEIEAEMKDGVLMLIVPKVEVPDDCWWWWLVI